MKSFKDILLAEIKDAGWDMPAVDEANLLDDPAFTPWFVATERYANQFKPIWTTTSKQIPPTCVSILVWSVSGGLSLRWISKAHEDMPIEYFLKNGIEKWLLADDLIKPSL